ncbi:hypothetical protein B0H19DRAFT_1069374 [Mycena capillaripes]|nr:hypothetical protein B0H19DRAFT_1069374 [Mycena capillaripes]
MNTKVKFSILKSGSHANELQGDLRADALLVVVPKDGVRNQLFEEILYNVYWDGRGHEHFIAQAVPEIQSNQKKEGMGIEGRQWDGNAINHLVGGVSWRQLGASRGGRVASRGPNGGGTGCHGGINMGVSIVREGRQWGRQ